MTVSFWVLIPFLIAGVLLAFWRPRVALLLPLMFHAGYLVRSRIPLGGMELPTTLLEVLIGVAVLSSLIHWRSTIASTLRTFPLSLLIFGSIFVASATVSAVIAPHPRIAWGQWKALIIEPIAYAAVLLPFLRTAEGRSAVARGLLWGGIVSAGLSLAALTYCLLPTPLEAGLLTGPTAYCPFTTDFFRLRGIYDVPNSLALVLAPLTVFSTIFALDALSPVRRLSRGALVLFVPTLFLTQSFAGIGSAAAITLWIFARKKFHRAIRILMLALMIVLTFLWFTGRITHAVADNSPLRARLQIWAVSLALVRDHPILGTGLGTFEPAYQAKLGQLLTLNPELGTHGFQFQVLGSRFPLEWVVRDPHNIVLSFWLNTGLLGLLSMTGLVVLAFRRSSLPTFHFLLPAAQAALTAALLFGLVDVPYFKNDLALLWWAYIVNGLETSTSRSASATSAP
ncbi:MAG: O-antigen ligase family protein [bacterium]|nr:O-antigen ligase family protein [bacterium]